MKKTSPNTSFILVGIHLPRGTASVIFRVMSEVTQILSAIE
jgi:hypothetical protein